jgi:hypothetical protein
MLPRSTVQQSLIDSLIITIPHDLRISRSFIYVKSWSAHFIFLQILPSAYCFQSLLTWKAMLKALPGIQDRYIGVFSLVLLCAGSSVVVCCFIFRAPRHIYQSTHFQVFFLDW